jgi:hypothetical protein
MHLENSMEYFIEHKRELTEEEQSILNYLLSTPELRSYSEQVKSIFVVARCGCGKCPTVLFGNEIEDAPITNGEDLIQFQGTNLDGEIVGLTVMTSAGKLVELEASSFSGGDIKSWPPIESLVLVNA